MAECRVAAGVKAAIDPSLREGNCSAVPQVGASGPAQRTFGYVSRADRPKMGCCWTVTREDCFTVSRCPLFSENRVGRMGRNRPLAPLTTLKVGGPAALMARPAGLEELRGLLEAVNRLGCPFTVLGRGSNVLVADEGYAGVVIVMGGDLARIELLDGGPLHRFAAAGEVLLRVEAGCSIAALLCWCQERKLTGLEFLVGVPGSLGGAAVMNAGAHGHCLGQLVVALELVSAQERREFVVSDHRTPHLAAISPAYVPEYAAPVCLSQSAAPCDRLHRGPCDRLHDESGERLRFAYRGVCGLPGGSVVGSLVLALRFGDAGRIKEMKREYLESRRRSQPQGVASAGSFFKNPPGDYAGRLIEEAGLKGVRVGDAEVSEVHANFLLNRGGAKAVHLLELMRLVQERVLARHGVALEPEVRLLGGGL